MPAPPRSRRVLVAALFAALFGFAPSRARAQAGVAGADEVPLKGYVRVHIDTPSPNVELFRLRWARERRRIRDFADRFCRAPCDAYVDGRGDERFRIGGEDVSPSPTFRLDDRTGDVSLSVDPGRPGWWWTGLRLVVFGGGLGIGGSIALFSLGAVLPEKPMSVPGRPPTGGNDLSGTPFFVAGGAVLGATIGLMATGIVLMKKSHGHVVFTTPPEVRISSRGLGLTPAGPVFTF